MSRLSRLTTRFRWSRRFRPFARTLEEGILHRSGPLDLTFGPEDLVVALLVRDGAAHMESFLDHHRRLGARHFVVLDNGSGDATPEIARAAADVTLLETDLPFGSLKAHLRAWLRMRFSDRGWCLLLDVDERFEYPRAGTLPLPRFLAYLNRRGFTAVRAHMLDLFSPEPIRRWPENGPGLEKGCRLYDLSTIRWIDDAKRTGVAGNGAPNLGKARGGVRALAFGTEAHLTKHPLQRWCRGCRPSLKSAHRCHAARLADVSCVLRHYKFDRRFADRCREAVARGCFWNGSSLQKSYLAAVEGRDEYRLPAAEPRTWAGVDRLLEEGFLRASDAYLQYANGSAR